MSSKSRGLGKGLSALLSESYGTAGEAAREQSEGRGEQSPNLLPVGRLQPSRYQPRRHFDETALRELAVSIEKNGIMQPILVRAVEGDRFEIVAGERRWRAAQIARLDMVPVLVRDLSDRQALELAIVENVQRQDLNAVEEAIGYQRLMDEFGYTQEKVAGTIGKSRSHVANSLRLLGLPAAIRKLLEDGTLSAGHGRALLGSDHPATLAKEVMDAGLSVRQTEELARSGIIPSAAPAGQGRARGRGRGPQEKDPDVLVIEEMLSNNLGLEVHINDRGQSGNIVITYQTLTELDFILKRIGGRA